MASRLDAKHERILRALLKQADNRRCADCETLVSAPRGWGKAGPAGCFFFFRDGVAFVPPFLGCVACPLAARGEKGGGDRGARHKGVCPHDGQRPPPFAPPVPPPPNKPGPSIRGH